MLRCQVRSALSQKPLERNSSACSSLGSASLRRHLLILTESMQMPHVQQNPLGRSLSFYSSPSDSMKLHGCLHTIRGVFTVAIAICSLCGLLGCAKETVAHRQGERQANRILVLLRSAGIKAKKVPDQKARDLRFHIVVREQDVSQSLTLLEKYNLPEQPRVGTAESFGSGGIIPTATHEKAKQVVGVEGDIVNALRKIPRVISAEAAVSIPEVDPLQSDMEALARPKASVIIVYMDDVSGQPPVSVEEIQQHVQAKVPMLSSKDVNVLLLARFEESSIPATTSSVDCTTHKKVLGIYICGDGIWVVYIVLVLISLGFGLMTMLLLLAVLRLRKYRQDLARRSLPTAAVVCER